MMGFFVLMPGDQLRTFGKLESHISVGFHPDEQCLLPLRDRLNTCYVEAVHSESKTWHCPQSIRWLSPSGIVYSTLISPDVMALTAEAIIAIVGVFVGLAPLIAVLIAKWPTIRQALPSLPPPATISIQSYPRPEQPDNDLEAQNAQPTSKSSLDR